jgi:hypothetical protein
MSQNHALLELAFGLPHRPNPGTAVAPVFTSGLSRVIRGRKSLWFSRENLHRKPLIFPLNVGRSGFNFPLNQSIE